MEGLLLQTCSVDRLTTTLMVDNRMQSSFSFVQQTDEGVMSHFSIRYEITIWHGESC